MTRRLGGLLVVALALVGCRGYGTPVQGLTTATAAPGGALHKPTTVTVPPDTAVTVAVDQVLHVQLKDAQVSGSITATISQTGTVLLAEGGNADSGFHFLGIRPGSAEVSVVRAPSCSPGAACSQSRQVLGRVEVTVAG